MNEKDKSEKETALTHSGKYGQGRLLVLLLNNTSGISDTDIQQELKNGFTVFLSFFSVFTHKQNYLKLKGVFE